MTKPFYSKFKDEEIEKILTMALGSKRLTEAEYQQLVSAGKAEPGVWYRIYSDAQKKNFKRLYDGEMQIFVVDDSLDEKSSNAISNAAVFLALSKKADSKTVNAYKVNGKLISGNPTLAALDLLVGGQVEELKAMNVQQALEKITASMKVSDKVLLDQVLVSATLAAENDRLRALIDNAGHHHALSYDAEDGFKICGRPLVLRGHGAPSATTIPDQKGIPFSLDQVYINLDASSNGRYYAVGTTSVSDWRK